MSRKATTEESSAAGGRQNNISRVNDMNNQEQFAEFLHCCREQRVKRIHLAEPCLIVNSSAGDFGSILIEFEQSNYFITSKYLPHQLEDEEIDEFCVKQYERLADLKNDDLLEADIYKTLSSEDAPILFLAEMVDAEGFFNGMEWTYGTDYLFFLVSCPAIAVFAGADEELKHLNYPHQFGEEFDPLPNRGEPFELFPGA